MEDFYRIRRLPPYVFEQVNRAKAAARNAGADIIDLGMGNPDLPTPSHVIDKLKDTLGKPRTDRYSASRGIVRRPLPPPKTRPPRTPPTRTPPRSVRRRILAPPDVRAKRTPVQPEIRIKTSILRLNLL